MKSSRSFRNLLVILTRYKVFAAALFIVLFLLLIRIPMGTFNETSWIDTIAHVLLPAVGAPLLYAWLAECSILPRLRPKSLVLFILLLGIGLEVGWEIIEFAVDQTFHLDWQLGNTDTMVDMVSGVIGSFIGGMLFVKFSKTK